MPGSLHEGDRQVLRGDLAVCDRELPLRVVGLRVQRGQQSLSGLVHSKESKEEGRVELVQHGDRLSVTVTNPQGAARLSLSRG